MMTKYEPANDNMNAKDCDYYQDSSCNIYQVGHMIIPIVQRRKLRLTEVKASYELAQLLRTKPAAVRVS